jgi:pimeloyl-ACP methyl ester carboxylesterase
MPGFAEALRLTIGRTYLSLIHPRLLTTLVLLDPVILPPEIGSADESYRVVRMSTWRRDLWPSQEDAARGFKKSNFYAAWDSRVLERWLQYGLRKLPTLLYPDFTEHDKTVTLKTTKHQEVFTFMRPNFEGFESGKFDRKKHADINVKAALNSPFVRPEGFEAFRRLPNLRPSVLYIFGHDSDLSTPERRKAMMDVTGIDVGGSGGERDGRVKEVVLEGIGHLVAMEAVCQCADSAAEWIGAELKRWNAEEDEFRNMWIKKSLIQKTTIDDKWREMIGGRPGTAKGPGESKL